MALPVVTMTALGRPRPAMLAAVALTTALWGLSAGPGLAAAAAARPDWNGVWVVADGFMDKQDGTSVAAPGRSTGGGGGARRRGPQLKGAYLVRQEADRKATEEGRPTNDKGARCFPQGMPRFWNGPYAFEIIQSGNQINIYQEYNEQTRRIYFDGRKHPDPDDVEPTSNGHSIGHWEGAALVVDTVGLREGGDILEGLTHSDAAKISERFVSTGPDLLEITMTMQDEKALAEPWTSTIRLRRKPGMEVQEYICEENNRNPVGEDGVTGAILNQSRGQ